MKIDELREQVYREILFDAVCRIGKLIIVDVGLMHPALHIDSQLGKEPVFTDI
jgi:hypothetical protein